MALYPQAERGRRARRWLLLASVLVWVGSYGHSDADVIGAAQHGVVPGQALIRFDPGVPETLRATTHAALGARVERTIPGIGYDLVSFAGDVDAVVAGYRSLSGVDVAEPNFTGRIALAPDDSCLGATCTGQPKQWQLAMTNAAFGWDRVPGRTFDAAAKRALPRITIAVLDTKVDASHPDFANLGDASSDARAGGQLDLEHARDWVPASHQVGAAAYHGTFVAGLAAAATGNGIDAAGVGYRATILPLAVVDGGGNTDAARLAEALIYAWEHGARVINLSLGILGDSAAVHDAVRAVTSGTTGNPPSLVVAAAGNNTGSAPFFPGSYPEVLSVAGTDADDRPAPCSNHNANVGVSAPADRLIGLAPMPQRVMQAACGTSAAAPQVSGLAALLLAQDATRTPAQVRSIIQQSADDLGPAGRDDRFGHGRINVERALHTAGARVSGVAGTVVVASGGSSTITATASSSRGVRAAQLVFDRPDAPPSSMTAADGSFGGTLEQLRATIQIPHGLAPGAHPVYVRAFDGLVWSAHAVGVVAIDATPPAILQPSAGNAIRAAGQPLAVTFTLADDYAPVLHYGVQFFSGTTGALVFQDSRASVAPGPHEYRWLPGLTVPAGPYTVKIIAVDQVGNAATKVVGSVVT
ncbi:MAG TPA: S8 family serine peptidase [Actinomycetota bacterium]